MSSERSLPAPAMLLPSVPVFVMGPPRPVWLTADGEIESPGPARLLALLEAHPAILVDRHTVSRRLRPPRLDAFDLLELFAFVRPAVRCAPSPRGVLLALGIAVPATVEALAGALREAALCLLHEIGRRPDRQAVEIARTMAAAGWRWGPSVLAALDDNGPVPTERPRHGLAVWRRLPEWEDRPQRPPAGSASIDADDACARLQFLLRAGRPGAAAIEARSQQLSYAAAIAQAFAPRGAPGEPVLVLAEAGTGVGKTLGYLAPASLWAERNHGAVWVSTFTRNLQSQIDDELDRLHADPVEKRRHVVVRKGRENYVCLLNVEEAVQSLGLKPEDTVALGLVARWIAATEDGALVGGDLPGWLVDLAGRRLTIGLADRRGECIFSACPHYRTCFIEHSQRRARDADIVIANHALVMIQAAQGTLDDGQPPLRYVFDEGHHLFEAADGAFSAHLSGVETAELRRWIAGVESRPGRTRGLRRRIEDLLADDDAAVAAMQALLVAAAGLPGEGWAERLRTGRPNGPIERFLALVRTQVLARTAAQNALYDLETDAQPPIDLLLPAADAADRVFSACEAALASLTAYLRGRLEDDEMPLETALRVRIDAVLRGLDRRATRPIAAWRMMLADLSRPRPATMVDFMSIERAERRELDVGLHRHWIDPTIPFAAAVLAPTHGAAITSATLTDPDDPIDPWLAAETRSGASHLVIEPQRSSVPSPFDYKARTRAIVVTGIDRNSIGQIAAAYHALFMAAGGGALGLFTSIARLREVHARLLPRLEAAGMALLAQHVDGSDVSTLIDIFRAEMDACLLGTDAVRDGVDVPGRALRLIVMDRVPWPRPSILHRARRQSFGVAAYDDRLTRLRLRQAFGRLIRRADDRGVFVMLEAALPSRLAGFLPDGVVLERLRLDGAAAAIAEWLDPERER